MKILYHINFPDTLYAARFIYEGYKSAFTDMGHEFCTYTASDNLREKLEATNPDIMITSFNWYSLRYLDLNLLKIYRDNNA